MPIVALAPEAAIIIALIVLLVAFIIAKLAENMTPDIHIPFVGNLRTKVGDIAKSAIHGISGAADSLLGSLHSMLHLTVKFFLGFAHTLWHAGAETVTTVAWLVSTFIPRELSKLRHLVSNVTATLEHKIAAAISKADRWALHRIVNLEHRVTHVLAEAEHYTDKAVHDAVNAAKLGASEVEKIAQAAATDAERAAKAAASAALAEASRALNAAIVGVQNTVNVLDGNLVADYTKIENQIGALSTSLPAHALAALGSEIEAAATADWSTITTQVDGLERELGTSFPDVRAWAESIPTAAISDIAGLTAVSVAGVGLITRLAEQCIVPNCRNLSGLGSLLSGLEGALEAGALLALLIELAQNPSGFADDVQTILGPLASDNAGSFRSLLGV